jgi:hypothetical protein
MKRHLQFIPVALVAVLITGALLVSCSKQSVPNATPNTPGTPITPSAPNRTIKVSSASALKDALLNARAGDEIVLANGTYSGRFVIPASANGTAVNRIILRGSRDAILDGGTQSTGYVLHMQASYWDVVGFTIQNGKKGIMADGVNHSTIDSIKVHNIGEEAIHLRKFSSHNIVKHTEITNIGLLTPDYGEGIYIGTAKSNWVNVTGGAIDKSDSNKVINNKIGPNVKAECIDIKEGTTGGLISGNTFDATGISGANSADSWIDVKGNYYIIENNIGHNNQPSALVDGYQVNCAYAGWGNYNEFKNNTSNVNAAGYGINVRLTSSNGTAVGNKVYTNNIVNGAAKGVSNIPLSN